MPGPYPVTPGTLTSLSWKWDWARFLIDSCWAEGWRGREGGENGKDHPPSRNDGTARVGGEWAGLGGSDQGLGFSPPASCVPSHPTCPDPTGWEEDRL